MTRLLKARHLPTALLVLVSTALVAAAPAGRYMLGDDVVHDRRTNLDWQRVDDGVLRTHAQALAFCQGAHFGARVGWRLPTVLELQTLIDVRASAPALDTEAFPSPDGVSYQSAVNYWSSTGDAKTGGNNAWWVDVRSGSANVSLLSSANYVRCVR